jgi:hypothetical protein
LSSSRSAAAHPAIYLVFFLVALMLAAFGILAPLLYLLAMKVIFSVVVSMKIAGWESGNIAFPETRSDRWVTYLRGIPVSETRDALVNVHFRSKEMLKKNLSRLALARLLVAALACGLMVGEIGRVFRSPAGGPSLLMGASLGLAAAAVMCSGLFYSFRLFSIARNDEWHIAEQRIKNTLLYSAYIAPRQEGDSYHAFLRALFGELGAFAIGPPNHPL